MKYIWCLIIVGGVCVCGVEASDTSTAKEGSTTTAATITDEEYSQYKAAQITQKVMKPVGNVLTQILTLGGTLGSSNEANTELAREQAATLRQIREEGIASNDKDLIALEREKIALEREKIALEMALLQERQANAKKTVVPSQDTAASQITPVS